MPAEPTQKMREQAVVGASPPQFGQRRFSFAPLGSLAYWCRESCPQTFSIISDWRSVTIGTTTDRCSPAECCAIAGVFSLYDWRKPPRWRRYGQAAPVATHRRAL